MAGLARVTPVIREDADQIVREMAGALLGLASTTLVVTGAGGFLCSYLVDVVAALNDSGRQAPCRIIAVDNFRSGVPERAEHWRGRPDVRLVAHDVCRPLELDEPVDWIVHGASIASPSFYRRFPLETIDVNVNGTRHMLELARRGARGMLHLSSSEVYGDPEPAAVPIAEEYRGNVSCTGPRACYDESKRLGETLCATYFRLYGTPVKIVRPFNVYGPGQRLDDRRVVPDLVAAALRREPLVLHSDGRATRAFCYVRDAVAGMLHVLLSDAGGECFNVGNDREEVSIRRLAELVREVAGPPPLPIVHRASADPDYLADNPQRRRPDLTKMRSRFPWRPRVGLVEGLGRTLRSYREAAGGAGEAAGGAGAGLGG